MKRILNVFGVLGSIFLTIILTVVIFLYFILINIKFLIGYNGFTNTVKRIDVVSLLKSADNGSTWEDINDFASELDLNEDELIQILNNKEIKEQLGDYFGEVLSSSLSGEDVYLTKERITKFLNTVFDEYSKVSGVQINIEERNSIINSIDDEMLTNMNETFNSLDLKSSLEPEFIPYIDLANNLIYGNYFLIGLGVIFAIILLIVLFRFSYYKWISYVNTSLILNGILFLMIGTFLYLVPLQNLEVLLSIKGVIVQNIFVTTSILFAIVILLTIIKKILKKISLNSKTSANDEQFLK